MVLFRGSTTRGSDWCDDTGAASPTTQGIFFGYRRREPWFVAAVLSAFLVFAAPAAAADAYRLGPGDRIDVQVLEYPDLSGERRVQADGSVNIPLAGRVPAQGLTAQALADAIAARLLAREINARSVVVEEVEYRPFYILGDVENPGGYPFRPGLTVKRALALAGGEQQHQGVSRETIANAVRARQQKALLEKRIVLARMRQVRANAIVMRRKKLDIPEDLQERVANEPWLEDVIAAAVGVSSGQEASMTTMRRAVAKEAQAYEEEIASLKAQGQANGEELDLIEDQLGKFESLADKRLATGVQLVSLKRERATIVRSRFEIDAFLARARQKIVQTETELQFEQDERRSQALKELLDATEELAQLYTSLRYHHRVVSAYGNLGAGLGVTKIEDRLRFRLTREDGLTIDDAAPELDIYAGDILEVRAIASERAAEPGTPR